MIIKARISFKEYVKLMYSLAYKKPIMLLVVFVGVVLALWILCYFSGIFNLPRPVIYQYITLVLICIVQPIAIYITIRKNYYSSTHLREILEMELTPHLIKVTADSFYMEIFWNKIFKIVELTNWFLIYENNLSAIIIPKKDFKDNEIEQFKQILSEVEGVPISLKK